MIVTEAIYEVRESHNLRHILTSCYPSTWRNIGETNSLNLSHSFPECTMTLLQSLFGDDGWIDKFQDCLEIISRCPDLQKVLWPFPSLLFSFFSVPFHFDIVQPSRCERGRKYREVHLDLTPEIEVFDMLFERCHAKNRNKSIKQHVKYNFRIKFSWTIL